jgi:hypothetical protein
MEGTRKRERPWKGWTDEVEEDFKILGMRKLPTLARDTKE